MKAHPPTVLFSPSGPFRQIQIGQSEVLIRAPNDQNGAVLMPRLQASQFKLESIDGEIKVSIKLANHDGTLSAELVRNEWKVAPLPGTWDRNYDEDSLEVKNPEGRIVLQVRLLADRVQIQGAWPLGPDCEPAGSKYVIIQATPDGKGAQFAFQPIDPPPGLEWPDIAPMFKYPSEMHLGERA